MAGGIPVVITTRGAPVTIDGTIPASAIPFGSPGDPAGPLGPDGKIPSAQLPPLEHDIARAATEAEMLALAVTSPAIAIRTDFTPPHVFYLVADPGTNLANWEDTGEFGASTANPSVLVGLTAKNGTADTIMRSDAAPALDQAIAPTWTGAHTFTQTMTTAAITSSGAISSSAGVSGNTTVTAGIGSNSVQMDGAPNGQDVKIRALGVTDANVSLELSAKGTGLLKMASPTTVAGDLTVTGEVSAANGAGVASPTNSGIVLAKAPNWGMAQFYDAARTANNRSMDILFIGDGLHMRFVNDARNAFLDFLSVQGGQATGVTGMATTSGSGAWTHTGAFALAGNNSTIMVGGLTGTPGQVLTSTGNATTPAWSDAPLPRAVGAASATAQSANVNGQNFYAVAVGGMYRVSTFIVITRAATTSATMPGVSVGYTEAATGANVQDIVSLSSVTNTVGSHSGGTAVIQCQQGSNISYVTSNYASSGATSMQYRVDVIVERIS